MQKLANQTKIQVRETEINQDWEGETISLNFRWATYFF